MNPADEMAAKSHAAGSDEESDQQLRAILENLQQISPVEQDDHYSGIADRETSERRAIYSRLVAIEKEMKKRGSRRFSRYLVAILIGIGATLAWQSYGDAAKGAIATKATELGWSPEAKQMIASWAQQLGWTKSPAGSETQAALVAQTAPTTPSLDPEKVRQMSQNLVAVRETVQELAAGQNQVTREISNLESVVTEILEKTPAPPQPPAVSARKPTLVPPPRSRAPTPLPHP